jgi:hypothetical protein
VDVVYVSTFEYARILKRADEFFCFLFEIFYRYKTRPGAFYVWILRLDFLALIRRCGSASVATRQRCLEELETV